MQGIYEFPRGQDGYKVGSTNRPLVDRLHKQKGEHKGNVVYTFLDLSAFRNDIQKQTYIVEIAERIRREQLLVLSQQQGFNVFGDFSRSRRAVIEWWNGPDRASIPNWPDWLFPPHTMYE